jgi:hypothetical protein
LSARCGYEDLLALGERCDFVGMGASAAPRIGSALAPGHRPQRDEVSHADSCLCRVPDVEGARTRCLFTLHPRRGA